MTASRYPPNKDLRQWPVVPLHRVRRLLFIRTDRLGETLLNLPAAAALKAAVPQSSLTCLVHSDLESLLQIVPWIDQVITYGEEWGRSWWVRAVRLAQRLKAERFDVTIVSNPKKEFHLAVSLAGIPYRVGYNRKWGWLLTHRLPDRKALGDRHEVEYNLDLVRALGWPVSIPPWQLPRGDRLPQEMLQLMEQAGFQATKPFVVVHPWTSNPLKQWPLDRFRALIRAAVEQLSINVVVIGGRDVQVQTQGVLPPHLPVVDLVGRLALPQLAALLQWARVLISNDSGPVHLAAAVGTPTIVLFGTEHPATGPVRWGPWGVGHTVIWKPSMDAISVDDVLGALRQKL